MDKSHTNTRNISILQLASWLAKSTSNNKSFLLKPNDLRILYMFVLWDYISKRHTCNIDIDIDEMPIIDNDSQITIPEDELVRMVKLLFHNTYYPYFDRVYHM